MNKLSIVVFLAATAVSANVVAGPPSEAPAQPAISISEVSPDRFELVFSSTDFTSRDAPERALLLSSARLAIAHAQNSFVLLALPNERPDVHPARPNPTFGAKYGHWQPHWNYYTAQFGWQWWHPEWGADFWTRDVDPKTVKRLEVHAMIDFGKTASPADPLRFDAREVIRDLAGPSATNAPH